MKTLAGGKGGPLPLPQINLKCQEGVVGFMVQGLVGVRVYIGFRV
jgi:hypothetical protein